MVKKIQPASSLKGSIQLPADKSISHRAALFAALHKGRSMISNYSSAADPHSTLQCLRQLGVEIQENEDTITIEGIGREGLKSPTSDLDCGNSGTTMRLLTGIVGGAGVACTLTGDASLSGRTMRRIINPLQQMGIDIKARDGDFAPLNINRTKPVQPLHFPLPIASAQLKSCVLLAGLFGDKPTRVVETLPSRDHTERLLQLPVEQQEGKKVITSSTACRLPAQNYRVPGDFSAAAFWLVAGSIHPSAAIELHATGINPSRTGALYILKQMGASIIIKNERVEGKEPVADIRVESAALQAIDITAELVPNCIDELPVLLVAMLFAEGVSTIRGAGELRHKETDRLGAMAAVLKKAGAHYEEYEDGFKIYGDPDFKPQKAAYDSEHDHRIAMAAAVLALMGDEPGSVVGSECTAISYPSFWDDLAYLTN